MSLRPGSKPVPKSGVIDGLSASEEAGIENPVAYFIDGISDLAYMKDRAGRYLAINAAAAQFVGKTPQEVIGKDDYALFPPEVAQRIVEEDRAVFAAETSLSFDDEIRTGGETRYLQTIKSVSRDASGKVIGLVGISRDVGERKNLEKILRQREHELSEAQRLARVGTWRWERATDTVTWSDEIYRIFGRDRSQRPATSEEILRMHGSESLRQLSEAFGRAIRFGEPYSIDVEIPVAGGPPRWIIARGEVESWEDGQVASLRGTVQEITDRKQLEMTLRQRERELVEAHRIAKIGTWRWERRTGLTTWSEEIYRIYGMDPSLPPLKYAEFRERTDHSAMDKRFIEVFDRAIEFGEPYTLDVEIRRADGQIAWVVARGEVEAWEDGKVASLRGTVHEITERKRQEEQLALSENRYRSLVHASSQIVWTGDASGNQMNRLPEWQAFTGQSDEEVLGFGWADAIHPDDRALVVREWERSITTGSTFKVEQRLCRHDGVYRDMVAHAVPVRDASGQIVEWVGTHTDVTEQKQAQDELRRAHKRLENVLDSITDGLCVLDHDWRYIYYNENGARISGLRSADIVGKKLGDIFSSNKTNAFGQAYRRAVETGETVHFEEFYGEPLNRWFECNCYPSADGLTVYFRDITERKKIDAALRDSESRYRKLFESNMMGIGRPDRFGAFKEGNDELLRMTGYTREELEAGLVRWDTMTPPEYAELDRAHIAEAAERGSCTPYEKEYIRKDGSRVPILCGYALLEGSQDEYVGFVFDLTRQRAAEAGLREREQRFRLLAESLPELVWVTDPVGTLTYLSPRFLDYCGIPQEKALAFDWQTVLHPEERDRVNRAWARSVEGGEPYRIELQLRRNDGAYRHFLAHGLPMRNEAGEVERWVGSCTDIHDQKLAEEALRRSEKLAATGRLAASIAHEINNPLSSVINALYLALQDGKLAGETRGYLETAQEELARISQITTQTLRFHRQSKAATYADLSETMQSVLTLFRPRFMSRQIEVVKECEADMRLWCYEDELRQVFANLVSNALDAVADRGRLRIRIRRSSAHGVAGVRVTVADNGIGIAPAIRKRIFEPFFSTKETTGIGLGLWVSDGVIRKHGGWLRLRSSNARDLHGTAFSVFFPQDGIAAEHTGNGAPRPS